MAAHRSEVTSFSHSVALRLAPADAPLPQDNRLLAALPPDVRESLFPRLQRIWLPSGMSLHEAGDCMRLVYFPIDAVVSLATSTDDGMATELASVGNEGLIGLAIIMGGESSPTRASVLEAGWAFGVGRGCLMELFHARPAFQRLLLRYAQAQLTQYAQQAVCNRRHSAEQQFCRWLLLRLDRADSNSLEVTHELIGNLLGVRRETITQVAGKLQKLDIIHYARGHLEVRDRAQLEHLCCECYAAVRRETDRLLPAAPPPLAPPRLVAGAGVRARPAALALWPGNR